MTMKTVKKTRVIGALIFCVAAGIAAPTVIGCGKIKDPLPSWNEGRIKSNIINFVDNRNESTLKALS